MKKVFVRVVAGVLALSAVADSTVGLLPCWRIQPDDSESDRQRGRCDSRCHPRGRSRKGKIKTKTESSVDWAEIGIRDTGRGIPENVRSRIFDPFFTAKEVGKGLGEGLAISRSVVINKHGGTIHSETEKVKGTSFVIRLPHDGKALATKAVAA